jgi:hypothetical protein
LQNQDNNNQVDLFTNPALKNYLATQRSNLLQGASAPIEVLNADIDAKWAYGFGDAQPDNPYYDYYYSGQDIQISIEGAGSNSTGGIIPIVSFAFNIKQEKAPLYGFWSYTYDAMMRGVRVINGAFTITTSTLNYMKNLLSEAAINRQQKSNSIHPIRGLDSDEENLSLYWGKNLDSALLGENDTRHLWSSHPPFNFVIVYGVQNVSLSSITDKSQDRRDTIHKYAESPLLMADTNERLVSQKQDPSRYLIENVELTSMQVEYSPDGQPVGETYSFIARDMFIYE